MLQAFVERIRQQVLAEIAEKQRETAGSTGDTPAEIAGSNGDSSDDG